MQWVLDLNFLLTIEQPYWWRRIANTQMMPKRASLMLVRAYQQVQSFFLQPQHSECATCSWLNTTTTQLRFPGQPARAPVRCMTRRLDEARTWHQLPPDQIQHCISTMNQVSSAFYAIFELGVAPPKHIITCHLNAICQGTSSYWIHLKDYVPTMYV